MKPIFITVFVLFCIAELILIIRLGARKNRVGAEATATSFGLFCFYLLLALLFKWSIPYYILLLGILALLLNSFVGYYLNFFERSTRFDRYLHGYGAFTFALLGYFTITSVTISGGSRLFQALFIAFLGIALGAIYEIVEYITDTRQGTRHQKGLKDTDFDLLFNCLGSALAAFLFYIL